MKPPNTPAPSSIADDSFVSSYLLYLLSAASEGASAQFHAQVRDMGLRVPEWRVLACLYDQKNLMITQLARFAVMEQSRMSKIVDRMENRGLLTRSHDEGDKRRVYINLTPKGREISAKLVGGAKEHEAALLASISRENADQIKPALHAILHSLEEQSRSGK